MAKKPLPTPELLRQLLSYDPETGRLFWKERSRDLYTSKYEKMADEMHRRFNRNMAGREAFVRTDGFGYFQAMIFGRWLKAHRVIAAMVTGSWPEREVDHINGDRRDNRSCNLRIVSHTENMRNCALSRRNKSGKTGVSWNKVHNKWQAAICVNRKTIPLGMYENIDDAVQARRDAEVKYGFGPSHGLERKSSDRYVSSKD